MITAASRMPSVDSLIAGLDPYPKMKDSGVKWLGDVPSHWHVSRLRNMAEMRVSNVDKHSRESETRVQKLIGGIRIGQRSAEGEIGLLNEYSIRLIADVVTGKLDVRAHSDRAASEI